MKDKAFANMMDQIAAQDQAERVRETEMLRRQQRRSKLRSWGFFLLWTALLGSGFYYHEELQQIVKEKFLAKPKIGQVDAATGNQLKGIQASAEKRDAILNEITK